MRKNKIVRACLKSVYTDYEVKGLNLDKFINTLKRHGIELYNLKKFGNKRMLVSIKFTDNQKFFAIAKELCYNIKKLGENGKGYPLLFIYRNVGLTLGVLLSVLIVAFFSDYLFSFEFTGTGSVVKHEIKDYLYSQGISEFSRFSQIDIEELEDGILSCNEHLSFVSVKKRGNRLIIESALSTDSVKTLNGNVTALYSDKEGVVESVKVYRGTATVEVGKEVKVGELLVDGYATIKEQTVKINVLASVTLVCSEQFVYRSKDKGEEEKATLLAEALYFDKQPIDYSVTVKEENGEYIYTVSVRYKHILIAG